MHINSSSCQRISNVSQKTLGSWKTQLLLAQSDGLWTNDLQNPETKQASSCCITLFEKKPDWNALGNTSESHFKKYVL